ncbi:Metacaspase-6 [Apostasia shenzhenica]|uniref:Metacaspase-6 n=1 Tax=Apostasia shenzhenica TaxID=1088818 RepID=A0A2H9ZTQ6_9ASPA|nr:Metacaspase-6 [Apostasia shenzhenica]
MAKKAVLIGCNYPGTKAELHGCINDVHRMRSLLIDRFGFAASDITVLIDTDESYVRPTGANIRRSINSLVRSGRAGDHLFIHFSGHGTRLPIQSGERDNTGYHECIVPCDMNLIPDKEFRLYADKVPAGCRLTVIADCCNSGGLIENVKEQIGESSIDHEQNHTTETEQAEVTIRGLHHSTVIEILKQRTGEELHHQETSKEEEDGGFGRKGADLPTPAAGRGILISGCQSDQTAADAKPAMTSEGAFGALSNAIQIIFSQTHGTIGNRELVIEARKMLAEQGFKQRPGLYCSDEYADEPFIC